MAQHRGAQKEMKQYLERCPAARERAAKDRHILHILTFKFEKLNKIIKLGLAGTGEQLASPREMIAFMRAYATYDRAWRKILQDHVELRGKDYDEKEPLEEEAMADIGYNTSQKSI